MSTVRFAPSPTGRFHLGNLRTAWISHAVARRLDLGWWLRFEDIDTPRVIPGAMEGQLADMERLGLHARGLNDGIEKQSERRRTHWRAFERAVSQGVAQPCICSRKEVEQELAGIASAPHDPNAPIYAGTCMARGREATLALAGAGPKEQNAGRTIAWRFGSRHTVIARTRSADLASPESCSFEPSYHWACALDDCNPALEHQILVRAWDLAGATPVQREIQAWAEGPEFVPPTVLHTALITQDDGHRLEKRTQGVTLDELIRSGWTIESLIEKLSRSFEEQLDWSTIDWTRRGQILGEKSRTLTLSTLLGQPW